MGIHKGSARSQSDQFIRGKRVCKWVVLCCAYRMFFRQPNSIICLCQPERCPLVGLPASLHATNMLPPTDCVCRSFLCVFRCWGLLCVPHRTAAVRTASSSLLMQQAAAAAAAAHSVPCWRCMPCVQQTPAWQHQLLMHSALCAVLPHTSLHWQLWEGPWAAAGCLQVRMCACCWGGFLSSVVAALFRALCGTRPSVARIDGWLPCRMRAFGSLL